VTLASLALPAAGTAAGGDPRRDALTIRLDRAGQAAERQIGPGPGVLLRKLAGVPSLVVRQRATLSDLRRAAPGSVREVRPGVWELDRTVFVVRGATLVVRAPEARELRLVSQSRHFATLAGRHGSLRLVGRRDRKLLIRSWQRAAGRPDRRLADGRGSVSVRGAGRLDAFDVRFEELGFYEGRVSGVALLANDGGPHPTGQFHRSDFVRNHFGAYSYEARDVVWIENRFLDNRVYGLDPHDDSDGFVVERNYAARNGRHGIIFSRLCDDNVIRDNVSEHNGWHGIVLDDGKFDDGPSNRNRIVGNVVRDNGHVGISIDGSSQNRVAENRVGRQPVGIRLFGRSLGNVVERNDVRDAHQMGVFVDRPARANALVANEVRGARTGVRVRGAADTLVRANRLLAITAHGVTVDGPSGASAGTVIDDNVIEGAGSSPVHLVAGGGVDERDNHEAWDYPLAHDLARALGWAVGPALWLLILGGALLGPLAFRVGGRRTQLRRLAVLGGAGAAIVALVVLTGDDEPSARTAGSLPVAPPDPRVAAAVSLDGEAAPVAQRIVTKDGHPTHPTWYHDSQVAAAGGKVYVGFNARDGVRVAELRASDLEILDKVEINDAELGGSLDSTGTDTKRHDVPTVVPDRSGRLHFLYGGGTISGRDGGDGPYHRATRRGLDSLAPERPIELSGGVAFDFEAVTDRSGVRHLIGQHGRGDPGSLVELRMTEAGRWLPPRRVIAGGHRDDACVLDGQPRGCNRFAIARMAAGPDGRLHLVWGYSEASLGGKCDTDRGYCDNDLYYAVSSDRGASWRNADHSTAVHVGRGHAIEHDDPAFRVAEGAIGLFKAVVVTPAGPVIVHTELNDDRATLIARRLTHGRWLRSVIARPGHAGVRSWSGAPVLRRDGNALTLWIPTGDRIFRFWSADGHAWRSSLAYRGPAWGLTGTPSDTPREQLLIWRGAQQDDRSEVVAALMPAGPGRPRGLRDMRPGKPH
jgi:parallel beta-helix repeat protein